MIKKPDKKTKPTESYTSSEVKQHMSVLMEDVREQIKGIGEEFVDFRRKLDSHTEMIVDIAEDVSTIKTDVKVLKEDVAVLKEDVAVLKEDMCIVKKDISEIKGDLKQKVDRGEFITLERRVSVVEAKITV